MAEQAKKAGYTVVDPVTVMGTHIAEFVRRYAHELFSRQDTKKLLDRVALDQPKLVEDLVPKVLSMGRCSASSRTCCANRSLFAMLHPSWKLSAKQPGPREIRFC